MMLSNYKLIYNSILAVISSSLLLTLIVNITWFATHPKFSLIPVEIGPFFDPSTELKSLGITSHDYKDI